VVEEVDLLVMLVFQVLLVAAGPEILVELFLEELEIEMLAIIQHQHKDSLEEPDMVRNWQDLLLEEEVDLLRLDKMETLQHQALQAQVEMEQHHLFLDHL
jgi:hypothetical protein